MKEKRSLSRRWSSAKEKIKNS